MKKLITLIAIVSIALYVYTGTANAADDSIAVNLTVGGVFTFAIGEDSIAMGEVAEGAAGGGGVTLWCASNLGIPWMVNVKATPVTGDSTGSVIPMSNLLYNTYPLPDEGGVDSIGNFIDIDIELLETDYPAYAAAVEEEVDTDVRVGLYITLNVPFGTQQDTYRSTITCTMYPIGP